MFLYIIAAQFINTQAQIVQPSIYLAVCTYAFARALLYLFAVRTGALNVQMLHAWTIWYLTMQLLNNVAITRVECWY